MSKEQKAHRLFDARMNQIMKTDCALHLANLKDNSDREKGLR